MNRLRHQYCDFIILQDHDSLFSDGDSAERLQNLDEFEELLNYKSQCCNEILGMLYDWHDFTFMIVRSKGMFDLSKAKRYVIFSKKPTKALAFPKNNQIFSCLRDYKNPSRPFLDENLSSFLARMRR